MKLMTFKFDYEGIVRKLANIDLLNLQLVGGKPFQSNRNSNEFLVRNPCCPPTAMI